MTGEAPVLRFHDGPSFAADTCEVLFLSWGPFENCLEANCPWVAALLFLGIFNTFL